jgi:hypothetical protein
LEQLNRNLSLGALFPEKPWIRFAPDLTRCPRCHHTTQVWKTHTREVATLGIGHFIAHETQRYCPHCADRPVFLAEELHQLVPPGARYGYDVLVQAGEALFLRCRNGKEIQQELGEKNIEISLREIDYLGQRFIVYLAVSSNWIQAHLAQATVIVTRRDNSAAGFPTIIMRP